MVGLSRFVLSTWYLVLSTEYRVHWQPQRTGSLVFLATTLLIATPAFADEPARQATDNLDLPTMLFVFMLASFIGLGVITRVSRLLHTPLMSLTNAISAIAVIGAITIAGADHVRPGAEHAGDRYPFFITLLGAIALFASTTNIVSGFLLTDRMLKMFKKKQEPTQP